MKELRCTSIFRDKSGNIIGYRLVDSKGQAKEIKKDALKEMIRNNKVVASVYFLCFASSLKSRPYFFSKSSKALTMASPM